MAVPTTAATASMPLEGHIYTDARGYNSLARWYKDCQQSTADEIEIDLRSLWWLDANQCALLGAMTYELQLQRDVQFQVDGGLVRERFPILLRNGFLFDEEIATLLPNSTTAVQMRSFLPTDDEAFLDYLENHLFGQADLALICGEKDKIIDHLLEVFANVQLHAGSNKPLFACGQYYPATRCLKFSLVDLGGGYLKPIEHYTARPHYDGPRITTAEDALTWALADRNTTKLNTTGGTGLKRLRDYCRQTGGALHMVSDGVYYAFETNTLSSGRVTMTKVPRLMGSAVHVLFNCRPNACTV